MSRAGFIWSVRLRMGCFLLKPRETGRHISQSERKTDRTEERLIDRVFWFNSVSGIFSVNRFRCPKGWRRLGGSCYYFPNSTSLALDANYTCELLYSNQSHHMQIGNAIEFFYAAHILSRQNLPALMIEIDPKLAQGKIERPSNRMSLICGLRKENHR